MGTWGLRRDVVQVTAQTHGIGIHVGPRRTAK
jgi:hypothetical protein